jgi:hypothetical protein
VSPIEEIAKVREHLRGRARLIANVECGERAGRVAESFGCAISDGGDSVAQKLARSVGGRGRGGCGHEGSLPDVEFLLDYTALGSKKEKA